MLNGIGLISMRERVRLVNGRISIQSKPNGGTSIEVHVPLSASAADVQGGSAFRVNGNFSSWRAARLLLGDALQVGPQAIKLIALCAAGIICALCTQVIQDNLSLCMSHAQVYGQDVANLGFPIVVC